MESTKSDNFSICTLYWAPAVQLLRWRKEADSMRQSRDRRESNRQIDTEREGHKERRGRDRHRVRHTWCLYEIRPFTQKDNY